MLAGFTGTGASFLSYRPWQETLCERINRLDRERLIKPMRFVLPDAFTALGGSQYMDSPAIGSYETYLWQELLPFVESHYRTARRGVAGKSSGGFGALITAMRHPHLFSGLVSHAGDMLFEWAYLPDIPKCLNTVRVAGGLTAFWQAFRQAKDKPSGWIEAMNVLAMAAAYAPNPSRPDFPADLPVNPDTLELIDDIWRRWIAWDPVRMVDDVAYQTALARMRLVYFDAGDQDEFNLQYGAAQLHAKLERYGIAHVFEIFSGGHFRTDHRYDRSLPLLSDRLSE